MPKSSNQKLKLIYLMKILLERTDETHSITMPEIIEALAAYDISAERKSLYNDIENLRVYGLDVIGTQEDRTYSYHIAVSYTHLGTASGKYFYKVIVRENEYVVLQYCLTPQYHSAFLREHFIGPQNVMSIMSVIGAVAIIIIPVSYTHLDVYKRQC